MRNAYATYLHLRDNVKKFSLIPYSIIDSHVSMIKEFRM